MPISELDSKAVPPQLVRSGGSDKSSNLDFLRAFAVLSVFFCHLINSIYGLQGLQVHLGRLGVILFFFHTSFVLMQSMNRMQAGQPPVLQFAAKFYLRRAFRIYPLAMLCVVVCVVARIPLKSWSDAVYEPFTPLQFLQNLFLVQNLSRTHLVSEPLWSLPIEVQMYVMLPFIFLLTRVAWRIRFVVLYLLAGLAAFAVFRVTGRLNLFAFIPCFLSGCMAYRMAYLSRRLPAWVWILGIVGLSFAIATWRYLVSPDYVATEYVGSEWGLSFALAFLFRGCAEISWKPLQEAAEWIARYSFGIYLFHVPWMCVIFLWTSWPVGWKAVAAMTLTMLTAIACFHVVENPLIDVGRRLSDRLFGSRA